MNKKHAGSTPLLALIALVAWIAVLLQLYLSLRFAIGSGRTVGQGLVMYFGFFTVLTNMLVCLAATCPLLAPASAPGRFFGRPATIGWVAASIAFVGIAYYMLLRHVWQPQGLQWLADVLLHYVTPILFVVYSNLALRGIALRWTAPWWWSIYLAVYFVYVLVRGAVIGSYPYGFIDVSKLGYAVAVRNGGFLLLAFWIVSYLLLLLWRVGPRRA
ncbi:Pr6Pr family membrane protein [Dyella jejuensis]|uniref:Pr6Pr family membrane protein n=1 Tax=Dyella jejuensis TaxID=1432009 RepID=A0ABW8JFW6_9GAMM